jgi:osmoprotectant transport system permease protein
MSFAQLLDWFAQTDDIPQQLLRHMYLSYVPVLCAIAVALPAGLYIGHRRRFEVAVVSIANLGRAIPSFAILSLALVASLNLGLGLGFWPTFSALFLLSIPPILVNTHVGVKGVDPDTVEAARGSGFSEGQVLGSIELPLAAPLIVAGIRTAAVQCVATATLGAFVAAGGLGDYIRLGFRAGRPEELLGGAILVAMLAIATEIVLAGIERAISPRSRLRERGRPIEQLAQVPRAPDGLSV